MKQEKSQKKLGRLPIPDERDKAFPMRSILPRSTNRTWRYWWPSGWWGNQGHTAECVAYAWVHWLEDGGVTQRSAPAPIIIPAQVYRQAQKIDQWPGEDYDGTSVRAGAKVLQQHGFIKEYRWTWSVNELALAILEKGPVVVGTNWYDSMFDPDPKDHHLIIGGYIAGGHAYVVNGVNMKTQMFRIKNSWGREWGNNGHAYINFKDMQRLLDEYGEAAIAVEVQK